MEKSRNFVGIIILFICLFIIELVFLGQWICYAKTHTFITTNNYIPHLVFFVVIGLLAVICLKVFCAWEKAWRAEQQHFRECKNHELREAEKDNELERKLKLRESE